MPGRLRAVGNNGAVDDEQQVRPGFLPPRAPDPATPPRVAPRPPVLVDRPTFVVAGQPATGPSSALAVCAMVLASVAIALLFISVGVAYPLGALLSAVALAMSLTVRRRITTGGPGRPGQARAAVVVSSIALGLAVMAAIVWIGLESTGFTPEDLERWLEDELERRRDRRQDVPGELA